VSIERACGIVGGGQHFDAEPAEQGARAELGGGELLAQLVVQPVRGLAPRGTGDLKDLGQGVLKPIPAGCGAKKVPGSAEPTPDLSAVVGERASIRGLPSQPGEGGTLGNEQAQHVVIWDHQEVCGIGERFVASQEVGVDMPVH
jgi:hypothetical protein